MEKIECPLCKKIASMELTDHNNRQDFLCQNCGQFQITHDAKNKLTIERISTIQQKIKLLTTKERLFIRTASLEENESDKKLVLVTEVIDI